MISMMKKVLIEKMESKYFLASHPYPKVEGEMIIFKPLKVDQTQGKDVIVYRDYSLRKRIETGPKMVTSDLAARKKRAADKANKDDDKKEKEEKKAYRQCLEVDITDPLSHDEWTNFAQVIDETQGLGWFQVMPVGQKSSQPYQFNMLHVLPQDKIPVG